MHRLYRMKQRKHLTLQGIFNKAVKHLLSQNEKSKAGDGLVCAYRGTNFTMCGAGPFIIDAAYCKNLEGKTVEDNEVIYALFKSGYLTRDEFMDVKKNPNKNGDDAVGQRKIELLRRIQTVHDETRVEYWPEKLVNLATLWGLDYSAIKLSSREICNEM